MFNILLRRLVHSHASKRSRLIAQVKGLEDITLTRSKTINSIDYEEEKSLFPVFENLNTRTENRLHYFSVPCDLVIKYVKLGTINKYMATQYCHYISHLARTSDESDKEYYSSRCLDLMLYLIRKSKDLAVQAKSQLLLDVSNTCAENCSAACKEVLEQDLMREFSQPDFAKILHSCYKFGLWTLAQSIVSKNDRYKSINLRTIEPIVDGLMIAAREYKDFDQDRRIKLRQDVIEHLYQVLEKCRIDRVQFATRRPKELIDSLKSLDIKVQVSPTIKTTGRCTSCNSHLPLFDNKNVPLINSALRELILKGADKGLYLNASPDDSSRFENFLNDLYKNDRKPIDLVIDGLNIAYRNSVGVYFIKQHISEEVQRTLKKRDPEALVQVLINAIIRSDFINQYKKILVVGKWHMTRWPGLMEFFRKHNIHFYSSQNQSKDDLYQLFASTLNPKTLLVTGDYFRDHLASMNPSDRDLLQRWIDTHQIWIMTKNLKSIMPTPYEKVPSADRSKGCFHIPIIDKNQLISDHEHEPPPHLNKSMLTWICGQTNVISTSQDSSSSHVT